MTTRRHHVARWISSWVPFVIQLAALALACYGVALIFVPAAYIIGGAVLIVAVESLRGDDGETNDVRSPGA